MLAGERCSSVCVTLGFVLYLAFGLFTKRLPPKLWHSNDLISIRTKNGTSCVNNRAFTQQHHKRRPEGTTVEEEAANLTEVNIWQTPQKVWICPNTRERGTTEDFQRLRARAFSLSYCADEYQSETWSRIRLPAYEHGNCSVSTSADEKKPSQFSNSHCIISVLLCGRYL